MIIFLNGCSSAGKSSLARELQQQLKAPYFLLGLDSFLEPMLPPGLHFEDPSDFEQVLQACGGFGQVIVIMARCLDYLIVDHVLQLPEWHRELAERLKGLPVCFVGVMAPLNVLEAREAKRPDRKLGTARQQFKVINAYHYDLTVDTSIQSLSVSAANLIADLKPGQALWTPSNHSGANGVVGDFG